eukprot:1351548-Amorphochlora_amoeboformis.AAC.2
MSTIFPLDAFCTTPDFNPRHVHELGQKELLGLQEGDDSKATLPLSNDGELKGTKKELTRKEGLDKISSSFFEDLQRSYKQLENFLFDSNTIVLQARMQILEQRKRIAKVKLFLRDMDDAQMKQTLRNNRLLNLQSKTKFAAKSQSNALARIRKISM